GILIASALGIAARGRVLVGKPANATGSPTSRRILAFCAEKNRSFSYPVIPAARTCLTIWLSASRLPSVKTRTRSSPVLKAISYSIRCVACASASMTASASTVRLPCLFLAFFFVFFLIVLTSTSFLTDLFATPKTLAYTHVRQWRVPHDLASKPQDVACVI